MTLNADSAADATPVHLPKGPRGSLLPTLRLIRDPRAALHGWAEQYGDPFLLRALNGPVVVTGREDLIRIIHGQAPNIYAPFASATINPLLGNGSMLTLEGEPHRRERRLIMPMFHGDRMKAYGESMQHCAIERLEACRGQREILTLSLMTDISLEIIVRTIFGGSDPGLVKRLTHASQKLVAGASPLLFFSRKSHFSFLGLSPWDRWNKAKNELRLCLNQVINERSQNGDTGDDILSLLCSATYEDDQPITREHIYSELMTFLFAGHETTALTLTWAMYHLHTNPDAYSLLVNELDSLENDSPSRLASAPYLKAIVQETLRVHPILTETLRKLKAPMTLGDYHLPAGMAVAPATVLAHYNPLIYKDPEQFRPERFLEKSYSHFQYMPFGGGHRRCIGAAFASHEIAVVLGSLLKRYKFELIDSAPVVPKRRNVTIGPSTSVPLRFIGPR
ncbi:MAG TPA: cytochrome P450 [Planctomycetaceae bacterium]|nr:cytochrome P450 [Planctomycetaceae bacterium]